MDMKRLGLLPKLIIAIILGIIIGSFGPEWSVRTLATFNGLFGNFLSFSIPLIIVGFVAPGIGDLGGKAGKLLAVTAVIAYVSTIFSGTLAYLVSSTVLPRILSGETLNVNPSNPEEALLSPYFTVEMPPIFGVM